MSNFEVMIDTAFYSSIEAFTFAAKVVVVFFPVIFAIAFIITFLDYWRYF